MEILVIKLIPIVISSFTIGLVIGRLIEGRRMFKKVAEQQGCDWHGEGV